MPELREPVSVSMRTRLVLLLTLALLGPLVSLESSRGLDSARDFLAGTFDVPAADLRHIDSGGIFSRTLAAGHPREVGTLGIARIRTTADDYAARLADIVSFKRDEAVLQIGTFSTPPQLDDVAALTLEDADIRSLRSCRVADCDARLPAAAIERFRTEVDWRAADVRQQATRVMQRILVDYVTKYVESGSGTAMEYADTPTLLNQQRESAALVMSDPAAWRDFPRLRERLVSGAGSLGSGDLVYWSKERVNRRPVISVTHVAIERAADRSPAAYAVASKQIYGMHYFDASLGLTLLVPDRASATNGTYVVYLNRSRIDLFDGMFGGIARRIVSAKARTFVSDRLARLQRTMDTANTTPE
jgi:hypothetical protein